jgi:hypothetical protein
MRTYRAALTVLAVAALIGGASASPRPEPVEHFTATVVVASSSARFAFRTVDIVIAQWSTAVEHRMLETALLEKGWVEFVDQLCTFAPVGSMVTIDGREIAIRYAWQILERGGHQRVFVATDEPITLANPPGGRSSLAASFMFLELHVGANGEGEGKLSEAAQLSVDQSQDVIELRDYANRPLHLVMVRSLLSPDD